MAKSAEVKLAIFGRAGVGKSGMSAVRFFSAACHQVTFCSLCADELFVQKDSCDLILVRKVRIRPGVLSFLLSMLFSPGPPQ